MRDWMFGALKINNYNSNTKFKNYYEFIIENHDKIDGDLIEAGVFNGANLLSVALLLKSLGSSKKIYGFDSFEGFPNNLDYKDSFGAFDDLLSLQKISKEHYEDIQKLIDIKISLEAENITPMNISTSADFSDVNLTHLKKKINILGLDNIVLVKGDFESTMQNNTQGPQKIFAGSIDCDLYRSYQLVLNFCWPKLSSSGMLWLDEYYSLKFPGARFATLEFCNANDCLDSLIKLPEEKINGGFERWVLKKT
jgi:hypothetical protein